MATSSEQSMSAIWLSIAQDMTPTSVIDRYSRCSTPLSMSAAQRNFESRLGKSNSQLPLSPMTQRCIAQNMKASKSTKSDPPSSPLAPTSYSRPSDSTVKYAHTLWNNGLGVDDVVTSSDAIAPAAAAVFDRSPVASGAAAAALASHDAATAATMSAAGASAVGDSVSRLQLPATITVL